MPGVPADRAAVIDFFCTGVRPRPQDGRELCADVADLDCGRVAARELLDPHAHLVDGGEDDVERVAVEKRGVRLRGDEQVFELVRDLGYVGKSQHQSRALDAVRFTKRMGNGVGGSRRFLELQQRGAERLEAVARFFDELADEDGRVDRVHDVNRWRGHTFVTCARSSSPISPTGTRAVPMKHAARSVGQVAGGGSISLGRTA